MIFHRSIAGSCYEFPGIKWVSQAKNSSEYKHTFTYPARIRSDSLLSLESCKAYRVHPCLFRSSASREFRNLPHAQTPSLTPQQPPCLTTTGTGNGIKGRITGSKTIIRHGTMVLGETPVVGMTTIIQRGNEGNTTTGSVSL